MRKLLVKYLAMNYDSKLFGRTFRHLRVVNVLTPYLCIAGLYNLLTPGFSLMQVLMFLPFIITFLMWQLYFKANVVRVDEMDWEQKYQYLSSDSITQWDFHQLKPLKKKWVTKYKGSKKFVEAKRFLLPWVVIIITLIIYAIFGFNEAGFEPSRFF